MSKTLTKAQRELLLDLSDAQSSVYCADTYRPGLALVALGFAVWLGNERMIITEAGRLALKEADK